MNKAIPPTGTIGAQKISVELDGNNHIVVHVGNECRIGNSYYLGLAPECQDHNCSISTGLRRMLLAWIRELESACNDLIYLPFDFSDETTRWLACQKIGSQLHVVFGWADVEGWAITPSDFSGFARSLPGFTPDEPLNVQEFYLPRFLSQIRRSAACCDPDLGALSFPG